MLLDAVVVVASTVAPIQVLNTFISDERVPFESEWDMYISY